MPSCVLSLSGPSPILRSTVAGSLPESNFQVPVSFTSPGSNVYFSSLKVNLQALTASSGNGLPSASNDSACQVPCSFSWSFFFAGSSLGVSAATKSPTANATSTCHFIVHLLKGKRENG